MFPFWQCVGCSSLTKSPEILFCKSCQRELRLVLYPRDEGPKYCEGINLYAMGSYESLWARWIKDIKRRSRGFVLKEERKFLDLLTEYYFEGKNFLDIEAIVPIPSHPARTLFETDLTALFATSLSRVLKVPSISMLSISKTWLFKFKLSQKDRKNPAKRWELLRENKFLVNNTGATRVLLLDDIATTGATLTSARLVLEKNGIECIAAAVMAQAPRSEAESRIILKDRELHI